MRASSQDWRRGTLHHALGDEKLAEHLRGGLRQLGGFVAQNPFRMNLLPDALEMIPATTATLEWRAILFRRTPSRWGDKNAHLDAPSNQRHRFVQGVGVPRQCRAQRSVIRVQSAKEGRYDRVLSGDRGAKHRIMLAQPLRSSFERGRRNVGDPGAAFTKQERAHVQTIEAARG